jgi:beta-glucosidase-like glycosyl hydrolase
VQYSPTVPFASNFPLPITSSCSFNRSLWTAIGRQIGREARAFMNQGAAYGTYWAPVINVARDPRWGRNLEAAGEDPTVTGQYAVSFVEGFQSAPEAPELLQASACCKHFVANELEAWNGTDRYHFDAHVTAQDLADTCAARGASSLCPHVTCAAADTCPRSKTASPRAAHRVLCARALPARRSLLFYFQ